MNYQYLCKENEIHIPSDFIQVQRIAYLNTREFPVPGRRIARLETQLECKNHKTIHLEVSPERNVSERTIISK